MHDADHQFAKRSLAFTFTVPGENYLLELLSTHKGTMPIGLSLRPSPRSLFEMSPQGLG